MNSGMARALLDLLREPLPEVVGASMAKCLRGHDAKDVAMVIDWHRRHAAEADRLFRTMTSKTVVDPSQRERVARAVAARAYHALLSLGDVDVIELACRVCVPEDVAYGMMLLFQAEGVPIADALDWLRETARYETRWCAAFSKAEKEARG